MSPEGQEFLIIRLNKIGAISMGAALTSLGYPFMSQETRLFALPFAVILSWAYGTGPIAYQTFSRRQ
jgi:hypothetical protein